MTWLKIDDGFAEHRKIAGLTDGAFRMHVAGLCYAARNETDGFVPVAVAKALGGSERKAAELISAGLWHLAGGETLACAPCDRALEATRWSASGWVIHDFLQFNPSAADARRKRDEARTRMTAIRGPRSRTVRANTPDVPANNSNVRPKFATPVPDPLTPTPTPAEIDDRSVGTRGSQ